ncbi:MAG: DUF6552 family protein [Alphaproteobacteria bacterium]|tara:strand:- start:520 stop:741 length:222 start_codon:yes stop_codon:yes gene_type:complete
MKISDKLKWVGTFLVLTGIVLTNVNYYPLNIFIHGAGVIFWTISGYLSKDKAILTNFGFQIPIFIFGILNYFI